VVLRKAPSFVDRSEAAFFAHLRSRMELGDESSNLAIHAERREVLEGTMAWYMYPAEGKSPEARL